MALFVCPACRKDNSSAGFPKIEPELQKKASSALNHTNLSPQSWTQFRGNDQGRCPPEETLPLTWSETSNIVWKCEIAGNGASSPVVSEHSIWMTTALEEGRSLRAIAVDKASGRHVIEQELLKLQASPAKHQANSYASPTPVLEKDRLFAAFGAYGVVCINTADGQILWKNTDLQFDDEKMGPGASPVLAGNVLIISCDGTDQRFIAGLSKETGTILWKTPRSNRIPTPTPFRKAFSTPQFVEIDGVQQIVSSSSYRLFGYDPASGRELWSAETPGFCPVPVPLVYGDWIFVCTGFNKAELWAFHFEGSGKPPQRVWKIMRSVPLVPSPVLAEDLIYLISDEGIASCVEARSGRIVWNERVGGKYWASVLHCQDRVYCFAENGTTTVLSAGREFKILAKNRLDGEIMATPAISENALFLRTKTHLYRLEQRGLGPVPLVGTLQTTQNTSTRP